MKRAKIVIVQICSALMRVRRPLFWWSWLLALAWNSSLAAELRVREERLCTLPPEAFEKSVAVSSDCTRAAFICEDGLASWVVVNGVATKKYPHLKSDPPLFSPDGSRVAFVAITAERDKSYVVVDGKEWPPVERIAPTNSLCFSPDGKRLALFCGEGDKAFVMVEGVAGPAYEAVGVFRFSPNGRREAYVATVRKGKQLAVVDGKPSVEYDGVLAPVFSPDSQHVAFVATRGDQQRIVLDGKEQKAYPQIPAIGKGELPSETPFFSPDGARMVYIAGAPGQRRLVEGQSESEAWESTGIPTFSPDSHHLAYHAGRGGKPFLVFDGANRPLTGENVDVAMSFSPDSKRFAHVLVRAEKKMCVIVDEKAGVDYEGIATDGKGVSLSFSPDSQHSAYVGGRGYKWYVVRDDVEGKAYFEVAAVKFSPDSAHLAYQADSGARRRLVVDGIEAYLKYANIVADHAWKSANTVQTAVARSRDVLRVEVTVQ